MALQLVEKEQLSLEERIARLEQELAAIKAAQSPPRMLKIPEAAKILGCSESMAYEMAKWYDFPAIWYSQKNVRIPEDRLRQWIHENCYNPRMKVSHPQFGQHQHKAMEW